VRPASTTAVVAEDGVARSELGIAPSAFVASRPPGTYTVARTCRRRVPDWELHVARLGASLRLLRQESGEGAGVDDAALAAAVAAAARCALQALPPDGELLLTLHVATAAPLRVAAHCCSAPLLAEAPLPVAAAVLGPPRSLAGAKASCWVRQRAAVEAARPADCAEALLSRSDGALLEGLTTNFFVVERLSDDSLRLRTAAPGDGVLDGVARRRLLHLARSRGLVVLEAAPRLEEASCWTEAFLSNAGKGVTPLREVRGEGGGVLLLAGPVAAALGAALRAWWAAGGELLG